MALARTRGDERPRVKVRPVARALCRFDDGLEVRLYATDLSVDGAFLMAIEPRPVGQVFSMVLQLGGGAPLPPIEARIITCHMDPRAPEESGIEVLFASMKEATAVALAAALADTRRLHAVRSPRVERRGCARVRTTLRATLTTARGESIVRVDDLSLTGALLAIPEASVIASLHLGGEIALTVADGAIPEVVTLNAQVVRFCRTGDAFGIGVRFLDCGPLARGRLEAMLLAALTTE